MYIISYHIYICIFKQMNKTKKNIYTYVYIYMYVCMCIYPYNVVNPIP